MCKRSEKDSEEINPWKWVAIDLNLIVFTFQIRTACSEIIT